MLPFTGAMTGELADIAAAVAVIPNAGPPDWDAWIAMGLRIWAATQGADAGQAIWLEMVSARTRRTMKMRRSSAGIISASPGRIIRAPRCCSGEHGRRSRGGDPE